MAAAGRSFMAQVRRTTPYLKKTPEGLILTDDVLSLRGDFVAMLPRIAPDRLKSEMLLKAARGKKAPERPLTVLDATAGLGEDSLILAAGGCHVLLCESDSVIFDLLSDALQRAQAHPELVQITDRMQAVCRDSISLMHEEAERIEDGAEPAWDVVYLDPMFPKRRKSGLVKKKFQLLQQLESPCTGEEELLAAACSVRPQRVIVKRPEKGPYLAGRKPSHSLNGKSIRCDVYLLRG